MTRRIAIALIASVVACAHPTPQALPRAPASIAFAVITWNMHAGKGDLPALVGDVSSGRLAGTPIRDYVLFLQEAVEAGVHDVETFARARNLYVFYSPVRRTPRGVSGNALVATVPLIDPHAIDLPRARQPRGAIAATIDIGGMTLFVLNAHLENRVSWLRGGLLSDRARGRQVDALLQAVPASGPAIVGGDLNTWLGVGEPAWRRLAARFPDTHEAKQPTFHDRLTLDHLFCDLPAGWTATQLVARDSYGSDHHPVIALVAGNSPARRAP